jgi:hypothetical protein
MSSPPFELLIDGLAPVIVDYADYKYGLNTPPIEPTALCQGARIVGWFKDEAPPSNKVEGQLIFSVAHEFVTMARKQAELFQCQRSP